MGDPLRLYGMNALVLNGGSGIGEAVARTLVKHGATVVAVDKSNRGVEQHFASVKGIDASVRPAPGDATCRQWLLAARGGRPSAR